MERILLTFIILISCSVRAEERESFLTFSLLGGAVVNPASGSYDNTADTDLSGTTAMVLGGYRFGHFSIETGVEYSKAAFIDSYQDPMNIGVHELINLESTGVPIFVKWHYIEYPLATFYAKAGLQVDFVTYASDKDLVPVNYSSLVAGVGGTSVLGDNAAFVLDISALQSFGFDLQKYPRVEVCAGFIFSL